MGTNVINSKVAQIIYNLKDYRSQQYVSTNKNTMQTFMHKNSTDNETDKVDVYGENLFKDLPLGNSVAENVIIKKIGIQAPPGTKFRINNSKDMIIGRTGIFELDERFEVKSLQFYKQPVYDLLEGQTQAALVNGMNGLINANNNFHDQKIIQGLEEGKLINPLPDSVIKPLLDKNTKEYWETFNICYRNYLDEYTAAYIEYKKGIEGIYQLSENSKEIENVIIDFIFE